MDATEIRKLAALEDRHWWYRERRILLDRDVRRMKPGRALDIGAAGGGNTRVLRARGWETVALEYSTEGAQVARERGLNVIQADARHIPLPDASMDLIVAFDILEHIPDDTSAAREIFRLLRPGGTALIAVPCDMRLWSDHDVAVNHVRRYDRSGLIELIESAGLTVHEVESWNVLLRPVAAWRRKKSSGSDLTELAAPVNAALGMVVAAERYLPTSRMPGVSLRLRATRPGVTAGSSPPVPEVTAHV
ncbi:class I SAM-dependent methyltransferase [Actinoplanes sp. NPDC051861]|uniref:class I SAM-dependent methyltransferase n=1 Tax=Actinoplanes sp. NPDC051861 TaxID=3155170 RepID=UPI0034178F43